MVSGDLRFAQQKKKGKKQKKLLLLLGKLRRKSRNEGKK
jgi:hypothetical protein